MRLSIRRALVGVGCVLLFAGCTDMPVAPDDPVPFEPITGALPHISTLSEPEDPEGHCLANANCGISHGRCVCFVEGLATAGEEDGDGEGDEEDEQDSEYCEENPDDPGCGDCDPEFDPDCDGGGGEGGDDEGDNGGTTRPYTASLSCPAEVTRGAYVECTFSFSGDGLNYDIRRWQFSGGGHAVEEQRAASSWPGTAVVGGRVRVEFAVGDSLDSVDSYFRVVSRGGWDWQYEDTTYLEAAAEYHDKLDESTDRLTRDGHPVLGWNCNLSGCGAARIEPNLQDDPDAGYDVEPVTGGPNDGLWWVTRADYTMHRGSNIRRDLESFGPRYALHPDDRAVCDNVGWGDDRVEEMEGGGTQMVVNMYEYNVHCRGTDFISMVRAIWRHEGFGTGGQKNGHEAQAREALKDWNIRAAVEGWVRTTEEQLRNTVRDYLSDAQFNVQFRAGDHSIVTGNWQGYGWIYNESSGRYVQESWPNI
jgi:hypothetical protein